MMLQRTKLQMELLIVHLVIHLIESLIFYIDLVFHLLLNARVSVQINARFIGKG